MQIRLRAASFALILSSTLSLSGQVATGSYPYGTFQNLGFDTINVGNLNVHFSIPLLNKPGRGLPFYYNLSYDSSAWYPALVNGSTVWTPVQNFGWRGDTEITTGYVSFNHVTQNGRIRGSGGIWYTCPMTTYSRFVYHDPFGVSHPFDAITFDTSQDPPECDAPPSQSTYTGTATDGSGYTLNITHYDLSQITSRMGKNTSPPSGPSGSGTVTDSNGNEISVSSSGVFTDTVGTQVLTVSGGAPNPETFVYLDTQGHQQTVTMNYSAYTVQTDFGCSGVGEYGPTQTYLVSSIVFPDGNSYGFQYEPTPNSSGNVTGRIASVTLPQGGVISYTYSGGNHGIVCADGSTAGLTRSTAATAGSAASTWTYNRSPGSGTSQTTVTDGLDNQSDYSFVEASNQPTGVTAQYYETNRSIYQGSATGTPLLARATCYDARTQPCNTTQFSLPVTQIDTYNTLNGLQEDGSTTKYNSYGSQTDQYNYDFAAAGSRGALLSHEVWSYIADIEGLVTNDELLDGSGYEVADTSYTYDSAGVTATSGVPQHISVSGPRGNLDKISYNTGTTNINVTAQYYDTGSLVSVTGPTGTSTPGYDPTYSFMTSITPPTPSSGVSLGNSTGYDANTGLILNSTDPNGQEVSYTYDSMLRLSQANDPDGGQITHAYTPVQVSDHLYQNTSTYADTEILYDAYDRFSRIAGFNGQSGNDWYQQDECYNADDEITFQSYRYQGTGFIAPKACSGSGDSYSYDALGRVTKVTHADGTYMSYTYNGRASEVTDEEGVTRISQTDGLGRTTAMCEISSNDSMPGSGSAASCGLDIAGTGFITSYTYNLASHTTTVQQGSQTRTFQTDWIGRPISVTEPESGQSTYSYSYNSTGLQMVRTRPEANQSNPSVTTTTTYQYDSVGRLVSVAYSDGTPSKTFDYDASQEWGTTLSNPKGQLVYAGVGSTAATVYSYDPMGRVSGVWECTPSTCGTSTRSAGYTYDWLGNLLTAGDGAGNTDTYTYSPASEVTSITSSINDSTHPPDIVSNVGDGPFGPTSWQLGNGLAGVLQYDTMGRVTGGWLCSGSSQPDCSGGTADYGFASGWKGSYLATSSDSVLNQFSSYAYDQMGRLDSMTVTLGTPGSYRYTYDRWGNRWDQTPVNGGITADLNFNTANNDIITGGYTYDAAGNMTSDGVHTYTYDADGNLTQVDAGNTAKYTYDALDQRVRVDVGTSNSEEFVFNPFGQHTAGFNVANQAALVNWIYWGATPVGVDAASQLNFNTFNWADTERIQTSFNGQVEGSAQTLPFGDGFSVSGTINGAYQFAGLDRDTESGTYHAWFRQYAPTSGRWMRPDPYSGSYDMGNPQSMNRYSYVVDQPLAYADILGLDCQGTQTIFVGPNGVSSSGVSVTCGPGGDLFSPGGSADAGDSYLIFGPGSLHQHGGAPNNPQQPQPQQPNPEPKPGWCTALNHAGNTTVALGGATFLWGTLADAGVVTAPAGVALQASGGIGMAVGGIGIGIADAGLALGICH
jgi:RHS repeat-associated protein